VRYVHLKIIFTRDNPTFSSERTLYKDYDYKGSFAKNKKKNLVVLLKGLGAKTN
jgi:hypothetical protein